MFNPRFIQQIALVLMASNAIANLMLPARKAVATDNRKLDGPYHSDSQHLWNRLHVTFFVRRGPDQKTYGQDRPEPLLWLQSKHLLENESNRRAISVLKEFLDNDGEKLVKDPRKRAVLQRDLWMVFNWLEGQHSDFSQPSLKAKTARTSQQRLRQPLAAVIGRLALKRGEIDELPNNYAAAVASGEFARSFDPEQPEKSFLPPDLFKTDGPWVCVGRTDGRTAPQHLRPENPFTNSVFLVYVRLPGGRVPTANYLKNLSSVALLLIRNPDEESRRRFPFLPNPKLPQFPKGTQLALVRQALLIDSSNKVVPTPLTESVQLRVIHGEVPALNKQTLKYAFGSTAASNRWAAAWQTFQELRLRRKLLFSDRAGGLHAVGPDERDFKTGFNAHPWDEFERPLRADQSFQHMAQRFTIKQQCVFCHSLPGVYSFNSLQDFRSGISRNGDKLRPFSLSKQSVSEVRKAAVKWKQSRPDWISLRKLLAH